MSSPRFLRVNFNFLFRASALMISPETKTGIPRAFITLEARLLPAPGIPTITSTVFIRSTDCKGGSRTAGNTAVIALKQENVVNYGRIVSQSGSKLRIHRSRRRADSVQGRVHHVITFLPRRRPQAGRTREYPFDAEIPRECQSRETGRSEISPRRSKIPSVHFRDQGCWSFSKPQADERHLGRSRRRLESG